VELRPGEELTFGRGADRSIRIGHDPTDDLVDTGQRSEPDELGRQARRMGFSQVASGPFVRSSYHARQAADAATA
jgi:lipoate synthase